MESNFEEFENIQYIRRRDLLPVWIKVFCWIFMIGAVLSVITAVLSIFDIQLALDMYGFNAVEGPIYLLISLSAFVLNGVTAYLLWTEYQDAVYIAKLNAYYSILLCIASTILTISSGHLMLRFELIFLAFFLSKMNKIEYDWYNAQ